MHIHKLLRFAIGTPLGQWLGSVWLNQLNRSLKGTIERKINKPNVSPSVSSNKWLIAAWDASGINLESRLRVPALTQQAFEALGGRYEAYGAL